MSKVSSLHYKLCQEGARWIKRQRYLGYKYIVAKLVCVAAENPDVWGTNGYQSTMIEVKTDRVDFLKDKSNFIYIYQERAAGNFRYYLCPNGIIQPEELPDKWGLLWWNGGKITEIVVASKIDTLNTLELAILCSIMRRENIKSQVFDYRKEKLNK